MANLVALTTVHDPGAADAIVEALNQLGIASQVVQVADENPYMRSALQVWQVRVPAERTIFLGTFIGAFSAAMRFGRGGAPIALAWALLGIKIGDLVVGLYITRLRHRTAPAMTSTDHR